MRRRRRRDGGGGGMAAAVAVEAVVAAAAHWRAAISPFQQERWRKQCPWKGGWDVAAETAALGLQDGRRRRAVWSDAAGHLGQALPPGMQAIMPRERGRVAAGIAAAYAIVACLRRDSIANPALLLRPTYNAAAAGCGSRSKEFHRTYDIGCVCGLMCIFNIPLSTPSQQAFGWPCWTW